MSTSKPHVVIPLASNARHLQQVYTGMEALAAKGDIRLDYQFDCQRHHKSGLSFTVDNRSVFVDTADSPAISQQDYDKCDVYFKRTLKPDDAAAMNKLEPFGLYFEIYPSVRSVLTTRRYMAYSDSGASNKLKTFIKSVDTANKMSFMPRAAQFNNPYPAGNTVMFYVRLWDPDFDKEFEISEAEAEDRRLINSLRIACVRQLKERFGDRALVGVMDDAYARKVAPDLVIAANDTSKQNYLERVKQAGVCIASTGLHESLGAKFAEYVALGKPIVSEVFNYSLPGDIQDKQNYLQYTTAEECTEQVASLLESPEAMQKMRDANLNYYRNMLTPQAIAQRIIDTVQRR